MFLITAIEKIDNLATNSNCLLLVSRKDVVILFFILILTDCSLERWTQIVILSVHHFNFLSLQEEREIRCSLGIKILSIVNEIRFFVIQMEWKRSGSRLLSHFQMVRVYVKEHKLRALVLT